MNNTMKPVIIYLTLAFFTIILVQLVTYLSVFDAYNIATLQQEVPRSLLESLARCDGK